jgi:hypothetical protein
MDSCTLSGTLTGPDSNGDASVRIKPGTAVVATVTGTDGNPAQTVSLTASLQLGQRAMFQKHGNSATPQAVLTASVDNTNGHDEVHIVSGHGSFSNPLTVLAAVAPGAIGNASATLVNSDDFIGVTA